MMPLYLNLTSPTLLRRPGSCFLITEFLSHSLFHQVASQIHAKSQPYGTCEGSNPLCASQPVSNSFTYPRLWINCHGFDALLLLYANPNTNNPYVAKRLKPSGIGFPLVLIALGIELPPNTADATRANSSPYGCPVWSRKKLMA